MSDYINHNVVPLFLKHLPVKTLLACRSVCRPWKELIDSAFLVLDHLAIQTPRIIASNNPSDFKYILIDPHALPLLGILKGHAEIKPLKRGTDNYTNYYDLISSIHGVICLCGLEKLNIVLWNPSLRRILRLPPPPFSSRSRDVDVRYCSFWIDPSNNDFKAMIFCFKTKTLALFSSVTQTWMEVTISGFEHYNEVGITSRQVLINGIAHWLAFSTENQRTFVHCFDFKQENFGTIDLPSPLCGFHKNLCKWQDSLSLLVWDRFVDIKPCILWVMQKGSWCKMFNFTLKEDMLDVIYVMGGSGRAFAQTLGRELVLHDSEDGCIRLQSRLIDFNEFSVAYDFVESLVFPNEQSIYSEEDCESKDSIYSEDSESKDSIYSEEYVGEEYEDFYSSEDF